jgi:hypothetical protein
MIKVRIWGGEADPRSVHRGDFALNIYDNEGNNRARGTQNVETQ